MNENALVLLPHQDDEYFIASRVAWELQEGNGVRVIYLTDGAGGGVAPARRDGESLAMLAHLGVRASDVHFLGSKHQVPDGRLIDHLERVWREILAVCDGQTFQRIYGPAWEGGHPDHDAASLLTRALARRWSCESETWMFSMYHGHRVPWRFFRVMKPILRSDDRIMDRFIPWRESLRLAGMVRFYASQWRSWVGLYPEFLWHCVMRRRETLTQLRPDRHLTRPHEGPLLYERLFATPYEDVHRAALAFCDRHS